MSFSTHSLSLASGAALLLLSAAGAGCAPAQACPPAATTATQSSPSTAVGATKLPPVDRHVYRFDFVLSSSDGGGSAPAGGGTTFSLVLQEADKGEVVLGKNVALSPAPPPSSSPGGSGGMPPPSARQDVGMKVAASFRMTGTGDDVVLDVVTEMSTFEPPTSVRKMVMKGNAIAATGKPALVTTLDDDHKKFQLTVTPTKLR